MTLSPATEALWRALVEAVAGVPEPQLRYGCEWMGWLPNPLSEGLECDGKRLGDALPANWSLADLEALEAAGRLRRVDEQRDPRDPFDVTITFALVAAPTA